MKWYAYVIIALLVVIGFLMFSYYQAAKNEARVNNLFIDKQVEHLMELAVQDSIIQAWGEKQISDSTIYAQRQDSIIRQNRGLQAIVRKYRAGDLRNDVAKLTPDSSESAVFVRYDSALAYRDSLITSQDSLVSSLYADKKQTWENFTAQIDGLEGKFKLSETYSKALESDLVRTSNELQDQKVKTKVLTWGVVGEAAIISLMILL